MSTLTASWTENQALLASNADAAAASRTGDIDLADAGYDMVTVTVEAVFGGTPDGNLQIDFYASSNSGSDDDTEPIFSAEIEYATSTTKRKTYSIAGVGYVAVKITNNDSTDAVTTEVWYAGRKWAIA